MEVSGENDVALPRLCYDYVTASIARACRLRGGETWH